MRKHKKILISEAAKSRGIIDKPIGNFIFEYLLTTKQDQGDDIVNIKCNE